MMAARRGCKREEWSGTQAELLELASLPELAECDWREEIVRMLGRPGVGKYYCLTSAPCKRSWLLLFIALLHAFALAIAVSPRPP